MKVEFKQDIFNSMDFKGVNYLLQLCTFKSRYRVFVELSENLKNTAVFSELHYDDKKLLIEEYNSLALLHD